MKAKMRVMRCKLCGKKFYRAPKSCEVPVCGLYVPILAAKAPVRAPNQTTGETFSHPQ